MPYSLLIAMPPLFPLCSRDAGLDEVYTPIATPARGGGRYGDMAGSTPGFGQTPTAAGYTPFRRPQMAEERAMPGIATSSAEGYAIAFPILSLTLTASRTEPHVL